MKTNSLTIEGCPAVLTVHELARWLRVSRNTAYQYIRLGKIRSVRVGRQIRIPRDALFEFLNGTKASNS